MSFFSLPLSLSFQEHQHVVFHYLREKKEGKAQELLTHRAPTVIKRNITKKETTRREYIHSVLLLQGVS